MTTKYIPIRQMTQSGMGRAMLENFLVWSGNGTSYTQRTISALRVQYNNGFRMLVGLKMYGYDYF